MMKDIFFSEYTDLKNLFERYEFAERMFVNMQIGYDDKVYMLFSAAVPENRRNT